METTKGRQVLGECDGKLVGRGWKVGRWQMCDCEGWELWGKDTWQDKSSHAGCTDMGHSYVGSVTGHCYRVESQGTVTGYCHECLPRINATEQHHSGI